MSVGRGSAVSTERDRIESLIANGMQAGPDFIFGLPEDEIKLLPNHPTKQHEMAVIVFDYDSYLRDNPRETVKGVELTPWTEEGTRLWEAAEASGSQRDLDKFKAYKATRYRVISRDELEDLVDLGPKTWETYNDMGSKGLYAPDVPHVEIGSIDTVISPKYLKLVN